MRAQVYVHDGEDARLKTMCTKAGAPLTSIDISSDEAYVQAGTSTEDLQFFKVADGSRVSIPAEVRDVDWASVSVPYGWCVQGCWKGTGELKEETAVQAAEKSPRFLRTEWRPRILTLPGLSTVDRSPNRAFLAKGCFDGTVAIYNYPAQAPGMSVVCAPCGHGSRIGKVRFTCDGKHLIALGQFNRVVTVYSLALEENAD